MGGEGSKVKGTSPYATNFVGVNLTLNLGDSLQNCQRKAREYNSGSQSCTGGIWCSCQPFCQKMLLLNGIKTCDIKTSGRESDHVNMAKTMAKVLRRLTF